MLAILAMLVPWRSGWAALGLTGGVFSWVWGVGLSTVALGVWRIVVVLRDTGRLDAPSNSAVLRWCRALAIGLMALGVVGFILQFFIGPIGRALFPRGSDNGVEFFVVGMWFGMVTALAPLGILLFEASRLLSFERWSLEQRAGSNGSQSPKQSK